MEYISITNDVKIARHFEECGINDIMVDLEIIGKNERQKGLNTVISAHNIEDVGKIKSVITKSDCLVRINPIHENSDIEIEEVLRQNADIVMLPMFRTVKEVEDFVSLVGIRARKYLLLETPQAMVRVDDIISIKGIDAVHIGLNDLSIGLGLDFLYEPLIFGIIEYLAEKLRTRGIRFGFGGVSRLDKGKNILSEHFRLGSEMVIINRDFRKYKDSYEEIIQSVDMKYEIERIDEYLNNLKHSNPDNLEYNRLDLVREIKLQIDAKNRGRR